MARFMLLLRADEGGSLGGHPPELYAALVRQAGEWTKDGVLLTFGVLAPTAMSARVRLADGLITAAGGPLADAEENVAAYALIEVATQDEAVKRAIGLLEVCARHWPRWQCTADVSQVFRLEGC